MSATSRQVAAVLRRLDKLYPHHPLHFDAAQPFQILVATMLSARTQDPTTNAAMARLWPRLGRSPAPADLLTLQDDELAELIKPVGFYRTKARHLLAMSQLLIDRFNGEVPGTREELLQLPGVGRKVANLVLNICFDQPAICVDIHVHRITNRLGWVATPDPLATELALEQITPLNLRATLNRVLVNHGQQVCQPVSPWCSKCVVFANCERRGVLRSR